MWNTKQGRVRLNGTNISWFGGSNENGHVRSLSERGGGGCGLLFPAFWSIIITYLSYHSGSCHDYNIIDLPMSMNLVSLYSAFHAKVFQ